MSLFYLCRILIIAELSADNTIMDHAKEKNMEKLINNAPFALVLVFLVIGFILLIKGADFFVEGSSSVAKRLHVPSIIIGLTIVAMGTSLPETAVSVSASIAGNNELAVSNVVGSNIFNLMVVIGVCAMIATVEVARENYQERYPPFPDLRRVFYCFWGPWDLVTGQHDTGTFRWCDIHRSFCRIYLLHDQNCLKGK